MVIIIKDKKISPNNREYSLYWGIKGQSVDVQFIKGGGKWVFSAQWYIPLKVIIWAESVLRGLGEGIHPHKISNYTDICIKGCEVKYESANFTRGKTGNDETWLLTNGFISRGDILRLIKDWKHILY